MASFSVSPSPYNAVKLELGVWLVLSVPVWMLMHAFIGHESIRLLSLLSYSSLVALRLLWKIHQVQRQLSTVQQNKQEKDD